jgi:hypothetical protein
LLRTEPGVCKGVGAATSAIGCSGVRVVLHGDMSEASVVQFVRSLDRGDAAPKGAGGRRAVPHSTGCAADRSTPKVDLCCLVDVILRLPRSGRGRLAWPAPHLHITAGTSPVVGELAQQLGDGYPTWYVCPRTSGRGVIQVSPSIKPDENRRVPARQLSAWLRAAHCIYAGEHGQ